MTTLSPVHSSSIQLRARITWDIGDYDMRDLNAPATDGEIRLAMYRHRYKCDELGDLVQYEMEVVRHDDRWLPTDCSCMSRQCKAALEPVPVGHREVESCKHMASCEEEANREELWKKFIGDTKADSIKI
jgi:hypothetical protein